MGYWGPEAFDLDVVEGRHPRQDRGRAPFEVVEGGGLDARAREGVSRAFVQRLRAFVAVASLFVALGACRVLLTSATVGILQQNVALEEGIDDARALNGDLKIERSVLSSSTRIDRIATQNYGMVYPTSTDSVTIGDAAQASGQQSRAQQDADAAVDSSDGGVAAWKEAQKASADDAQGVQEAGSNAVTL